MDKVAPPTQLRKKVLFAIRQEERKRARTYLLVSGGVGLTSLFGAYFSIRSLFETLYQSSFYSYLSLLFSDTDMVLNNWQNFLYSLAESAPLIGVILSLLAVLVLLFSFRVFAVNLKNGLSLSPNIS